MYEGVARDKPDVTTLVFDDREDKAVRVISDPRDRHKPISVEISGAAAIRDPDPAGAVLKHRVTSFGKATGDDLLHTGPCEPVLCAVNRQLSLVPAIQPIVRTNPDAAILCR